MTICDIRPINHKKSKILTYEGLVFSLYKSEIYHLGLKIGEEIEESILEEQIFPVLKKRAFARVIYILQRSDRSEAELRKKLRESYIPPDIIDETIERVRGYGYIDDARYAYALVERYRMRKSRRAIAQAMYVKGIPRAIISQVLEDRKLDEKYLIERELEKKGYDPALEYKEKRKVIDSLLRKGFRYVDIKEVL